MEDLLLLIHRIPYPPNKGDKIRSYHLLKHLARDYRVHLATFVDDADDWQHVPTVERMCASSHFASSCRVFTGPDFARKPGTARSTGAPGWSYSPRFRMNACFGLGMSLNT